MIKQNKQSMLSSAREVLAFWFEEIKPAQHFVKDLAFDQMLRDRFSSLHEAATKGELYEWRAEASGRLAEIILLDQFSRNMCRDTARSFAYDGIALTLAQEGVAKGQDKDLVTEQRIFFYMPYMHSESRVIHEEGIKLFTSLGAKDTLKYAHLHKKIIDRFGYYPHRNDILGRPTSEEERAFLEEENSSF